MAADHERRKIIISVRGTRSFTVINTPVAIMEYISINCLKDALTDLCADYIRIHVKGVDNAKVHKVSVYLQYV